MVKILFNKKLIVGIILGIVLVIFQEPIRMMYEKYYSKKKISYEVMSISHLKRHELADYAEAEGLSSFKLNLDDSILKDYYVLKLKLKNKGIALTDSLNFQASIGNEYVKIIDIKHIINFPRTKAVAISHPIPDLTWSLEAVTKPLNRFKLKWDPPTTNIDGSPLTDLAGFNIYRAKLKDKGFGKINVNLIKDVFFEIDLPNGNFFYDVRAIDDIGNISPPAKSIFIPFPASLAFKPLFKDVVWIKPNSKFKKSGKDSIMPVYPSLTQAIENEKDKTIFIVKKNRDEIDSLNNLTDNINERIKVLYLDDLTFLQGKANLNVLSGLDEDAEIIFYLLLKSFHKTRHDFSLVLEGMPEIKLVKNNAWIRNSFSVEVESVEQEIYKKSSITFPVVTTYVGENIIYLVWEYSKEHEYKGVRIFRSEKCCPDNSYSLGEEIYDGPATSNTIKCTYKEPEKMPEKPPALETIYVPSAPNEPPEPPEPPIRKKTIVGSTVPGPVTHVNVIVEAEITLGDISQVYFADKEVLSDVVYTYTLYAYDDKDNYSYPIITNASLSNTSSGLICKPEKKGLE